VLLTYPPSLGCGEYDLGREFVHPATILDRDFDIRSSCGVRIVEIEDWVDIGCGPNIDSPNSSLILIVIGSSVEWYSDGRRWVDAMSRCYRWQDLDAI